MQNIGQATFRFDIDEGEMEKKFWQFHVDHPQVYRTLVHFAREWRERRGPDAVCGISALYERARWEMWFESLGDAQPPKLSNNHKPFYARLIMVRRPDLAGIFRLKRQKVQATFGPENETLEPNEYLS
mgnify:FL=1|tara:strand:- start:305 stop:688 length:384 start_codon:yes stop_codon:yes gene_type:complete